MKADLSSIRLTAKRLDLRVGESVIGTARNAAAVSSLMSRCRPMRFTQKRFLLVDPESLTTARVFMVTRI